MKKIVALVLSLVMVLGLATTAFAAKEVTYEGLYLTGTDAVTKYDDVDVTVTPAKAVKYDKVTGFVDTPGNIELVTLTVGGMVKMTGFYFVDTLAEADAVLYKDAARKQVMFYVAQLEESDGFAGRRPLTYVEGVPFANFGEDCGQVYYEADADLKYFTVKGDTAFTVYEEDENGDVCVMYGDKLYYVSALVEGKVAHTPVFEIKNGEYVSIECGACDAVAVEAPNAMSIPLLADTTNLPANWYWVAAAAPEAGDKVESAETFDAGIAMYVGMSVMAAAGSAVVLKKKD